MSAKKVLVTGADGFIGSHLTELLLAEGYDVRALSVYNSFNYWGWLEGISHPRLEVVSGDVRDAAFCRHIARDSYIDTNVKGTLNICQAAMDCGVKRLIVTSTSEVYGTAQYVPIDEKHPRQPQSPYSATKIGADAIAKSFFNAFGLPVVIARPFNTYGPRQSARAIIPTIITQIASGKREIMVGDLTPTRDFNYVADTCRGFLAIARAEGVEGEEINIASGTEISMADTLATIARLMNADVKWTTDPQRVRPSRSEVFRLCGDNSKITSLTSWRPSFSIEEGLMRTIEWFTDPSNLAKYKTDIYNR